jgi:hypothetical protein
MNKLVYLSGPLRGRSRWEEEKNTREAEETYMSLLRLSLVVHVPHTTARFAQDVLPVDEWLHREFVIIRRCDGLVMMPRWEKSEGACIEKEYADRVGIQVFYWPRDFYKLQTWAQEESLYRCLTCGTDIARRVHMLKGAPPPRN